MDSFDFDAWAALARTDPNQFERERRVIVDNIISNSDNDRRLRGLQCRIDLERASARTPLKFCLRLSTLMWDAFMELNNVLNADLKGSYKSASALSQSARSAKIIYISAAHKPH